MKYLILFILTALLSACNIVNTEQNEDIIIEEPRSAVAAEYANAFENASPLQLFFKEDQTKAIYLEEDSGTSYTEKTFWLSESYVKTIVEKENNISYNIYRITNDAIELVYSGQTDTKVSIAELDQMPVKHTILTLPIERGAVLEEWVLTNDNLQVVTPFETFHQVVELTKETQEQVIKQYYAPGFGLVKEFMSSQTDSGIEETTFLLEDVKY